MSNTKIIEKRYPLTDDQKRGIKIYVQDLLDDYRSVRKTFDDVSYKLQTLDVRADCARALIILLPEEEREDLINQIKGVSSENAIFAPDKEETLIEEMELPIARAYEVDKHLGREMRSFFRRIIRSTFSKNALVIFDKKYH